MKLTPLHIAAHEGHTAVVERLVGYGADLNAEVEDGNTALHLIVALKKMKPLSKNTPHLLKVRPVIEHVYISSYQTDSTASLCMCSCSECSISLLTGRGGTAGQLQWLPV